MAEWHRIITSPYTGSMSMTGSFNVDGNATITGNVTINGTASVENLVVKQIGYSSGSNQLGDAINDVQTLYGTVRIPTGSLTVTGSANITNGNLRLTDTAATIFLGQYGAVKSSDYPNVYLGFDANGTVVSSQNTIYLKTGNTNNGATIWVNSGTVFGTGNDNAPNYKVLITGSAVSGSLNANNTLYVSGSNVGIGTSTPSVALNVIGHFVQNVGGYGIATNTLLNSRIDYYQYAGHQFRSWGPAGSQNVVTITGQAQRGKVGIMFDNPTASLHVAGDVYVSASAGTGSALQVYKSGSTVVDVQGSSGQLFSITDSLSGSLFSVNTAAGLPTIEAFSDNTVNIGKYGSYPIKVVSLGTSAVVSGSFSGSGANLSGIPASAIVGLNLSQIATGSVSASVGLGTGSFSIASGSSNFLFVSSSGNIGIGTTTPARTLEVFKSGLVDGSVEGVRITVNHSSATAQAALEFYHQAGPSPNSRIATDIGNGGLFPSMYFFHNGSNRITITSGGNVLIGTSTNSARLTVGGSGATSATTSFLVQNSAGTTGLTVFDNGNVSVGSATNSFYQLYGNGAWFNAGSIYTPVLYTDTISPSAGGSTNFYANINNFKIGTTSTATTSAVFEISSTTKGFLLPRTNLTSNISTPAQGLQTYITASGTEGLYYYNSGSYQGWTRVINNSGSQAIAGNLTVTGSFTVATGSIVEFQVNQTGVKIGNATTDSHSITGSLAISASAGTGSALTVYKSGSTVVDIQGSQGSLMSVEDSLTGSLMSVGNISGLPLMEVFDDGTMNAGKFNVYPIKIVATGSQAVITGSFTGSFAGSINASAFTASSALVTGNVTVLGTASINNLIVNQIGYSSGSNQLGDAANDTQTLYGTVVIPTGSLTVSGSSYFSGSVGIGTAAPAYTLDVNGTARVTGNTLFDTGILATSVGSTRLQGSLNYFTHNRIGSSGTLGFQIAVVNNVQSFWRYNDGTGDVEFGNANGSYSLGLYAGNTERVKILGNGNVGVGVTSPSFKLDISGSGRFSSNLTITGSAGTGSALNVYKSGSTVFRVEGSQGELFAVTDSLSGSLFSVSNVSGLPILEVFSDNTVLLGSYLDPMLITTQRLTANSGSTVIYSLPTASYDGVFVDYVIRSGSNARAGQFMGLWSGSSTNFTDSSTTDFGDTTGFVFGLVVSGSNMVLTGSASTNTWTVRAGIRSI